MASIDQVIKRLRQRQQESAHAVLLTPPGKAAFDFGVVSGTYRAYEQMLADIADLLEEEAKAEKRRENSL